MSIAQLSKYPADVGANICLNSEILSPITTAERNSLPQQNGLLVFNNDIPALQAYIDGDWENLALGPTGVAPFSDRRTIQTTVSGVWSESVNVQVDAARSVEGLCTITVGPAGGFTGIYSVNGGTGNGSAVATVNITSLPPSLYTPLQNNPVTCYVQVESDGSITTQSGVASINATNPAQLLITWPGDTVGANVQFWTFSMSYFGIAL